MMGDKDFMLAGDGWVQVTDAPAYGCRARAFSRALPAAGIRLKNQSALDPQALRFLEG